MPLYVTDTSASPPARVDPFDAGDRRSAPHDLPTGPCTDGSRREFSDGPAISMENFATGQALDGTTRAATPPRPLPVAAQAETLADMTGTRFAQALIPAHGHRVDD